MLSLGLSWEGSLLMPHWVALVRLATLISGKKTPWQIGAYHATGILQLICKTQPHCMVLNSYVTHTRPAGVVIRIIEVPTLH